MTPQQDFFTRTAFLSAIEKLITLSKIYIPITDKAQRVRLNICINYLKTTRKEIKDTLVYDTPTPS